MMKVNSGTDNTVTREDFEELKHQLKMLVEENKILKEALERLEENKESTATVYLPDSVAAGDRVYLEKLGVDKTYYADYDKKKAEGK